MDGRAKGWEGKRMKRGLYIQGDDPPSEHPSDDDQCPRLDTCGRSKNMKTDDAEEHSVSILWTLSLTCFIVRLLSLSLSHSSVSPCFSFSLQFPPSRLLAHSHLIHSPSVHMSAFIAVIPWYGLNRRGSWGASMPTGGPIIPPKAGPRQRTAKCPSLWKLACIK